MSKRPHPLTILDSLSRFFILLILPLARGVYTAFYGGAQAWLKGSWIDGIVLLLIFFFSFLHWRNIRYEVRDGAVTVSKGILLKQIQRIPKDKIITASYVTPLLLRPFSVGRMRLDTAAGNNRYSDLTLLLSKKAKDELLIEIGKEISDPRTTYRPTQPALLLLSMVTSSSLGGILIMITVLNYLGKYLQSRLSYVVFGTFENLAKTLAFGLPPAIAILGYAMLFFWSLAFLMNYLRNIGFLVEGDYDTVGITIGIFNRREHVIQKEDISYLDFRQSLLEKVLRIESVHLSAVGYEKVEPISAMIPVVTRNGLVGEIRDLTSPLLPKAREYRPVSYGWFKYLIDPLWGLLAITALSLLSYLARPAGGHIIRLLAIAATIPFVWILIIRILDFFSSGLSVRKNHYVIRYSLWFRFHTVVLPKEKVIRIVVQQSWIQKPFGTCDVLFYSYGEKRSMHILRNFSYQEMQELLKAHGFEKTQRHSS